MWEISLSDQLLTFLYGLVLGMILCGVYDLIRVVVLARRSGRFGVFLGDIVFWIASSIAVFMFLLARTNGELRGYVFVSIAVGFLTFKITLSKLTMKILNFIVLGYYKLIGYIFRFLILFFDKTVLLFKRIWDLFKKSVKSGKKLLKKGYKLLYTMLCRTSKENKSGETKKDTKEKA